VNAFEFRVRNQNQALEAFSDYEMSYIEAVGSAYTDGVGG
jgi:hypothetical protein